ncbi:MAG TPA: sialate O-acetylesterase [Thermoflexales bacterium]|nr:sialate O-acetylesterase [Thermoflexales bacterium]HQX76391.1 sialate O-acetylesterase [Thermoflexales bacterium]HRA00972.1 sialate O-acetylesterase [Thermoflexales bacterium]
MALAPAAPVAAAAKKPPRVMVALVMGQSNAANFGETRKLAGPNVFSFGGGKLLRARDPIPGANGTGGSVWTRLGDKIIAAGLYDKVIFIPVAVGSTEIAQWTPEMPIFQKQVIPALEAARKSNLAITHVLWHQGESDAYLQTSWADYQLRFRNLARGLREQGVSAPIFISTASACGQYPSSDVIRGAQQNLVNHDAGIWAGPDTDVLSGAFRAGCHFSASGLDAAANLWLGSITNYELRIKN